MPSYQDFAFEMWRGDTEVIAAAITVSGVAANITGCTLRFTAKRSLQDTDAEAIFQLVTPTEIAITDGPNGECDINIASANTASVTQAIRCYCDLQLVDTLGNVSTTATGTLLIKMDVTRTDT